MTASMVTNNKAIHTADVSESGLCTPMGEFAYLPYRLNVRQSMQPVQLLAKIRKTLTRKVTAFAIPNKNNEAERSGSHASSDDQVLLPLEYNHSSSHLDGESAASVSESGAGLCQRIEHSVNQASLLDKLKAVHLHVLASEQWNASMLKLCHNFHWVAKCGWERLADIQEEILSVSDVAHIPVVWATQVIESLVKSCIPTRAEIIDVANGRRASCIILNKGRHIVEAVSALDNVLNANSKQMKAKVKPLFLSNHLF